MELLKVREFGRLDNFNSQFDGNGKNLVGEVLYEVDIGVVIFGLKPWPQGVYDAIDIVSPYKHTKFM